MSVQVLRVPGVVGASVVVRAAIVADHADHPGRNGIERVVDVSEPGLGPARPRCCAPIVTHSSDHVEAPRLEKSDQLESSCRRAWVMAEPNSPNANHGLVVLP